jgi:hypothetical protein
MKSTGFLKVISLKLQINWIIIIYSKKTKYRKKNIKIQLSEKFS